MSQQNNCELFDVIVIGAGMAGVNVAKLLKQNNVTGNVLILEANDYIGGRLRSQSLMDGKVVIDIGGQWVGPPQPKVLALIKELGLSTFPQYFEQENRNSSYVMPSTGGKKNILKYTGSPSKKIATHRSAFRQERTLYTGSIPSDAKVVTEEVLVDFERGIKEIEALSNTVPLDAPSECVKALEYDEQTAESFMNSIFKTRIAKDFFKTFIITVFACNPAEVSALFVLWFIATAGGFDNLMNVRDAAQDSKIYMGSSNIVSGLVEKYKLNVLLNHPVSKIKDEGQIMTVTCQNGKSFRARKVVMSNTTVSSLGIQFEPPLPSKRHQFLQKTSMGYAIKTFMLFKEPFWRKKYNSNGFLLSLQEEDYITLSYDIGYKNDLISGICGFVYANKACEYSAFSREKKINLLLKQYSEIFGGSFEEWKSQYVDYVEKDWGMEEHTRGSYFAFTSPGALTGTKLAFREPLYNHKMFIAGTETATRWIGYMEGAIESRIV